MPKPDPSNPASKGPLIDNPITESQEDFLEVDGFAQALGRFIDVCDTPVTIGIQGDWGIGKTSLLNLLSKYLSPRRGRQHSTPHIYVNTWQHAQFKQEEWLGILILNGIVDKLHETFPEQTTTTVDAVKNVASKLGRFAMGAAGQAFAGRVGFDIKSGLDAMSGESDQEVPKMSTLLHEYREKFRELVEAIAPGERDRLVIMIDDLDRVTPIRAIELLEAIKNFLDVPKCVFVLAVDYAVIQQGVADRLGSRAQQLHGKSYFDKIIQVPFNMPTTAYRMDNYILGLLGWDLRGEKITACEGQNYLPAPTSDAKEHVEYFQNITELSVGQNPRSIKRVAAFVRLLRMVRDRAVQARRDEKGKGASRPWDIHTAKILYALACVQIEWPELFKHLIKNPVPGTLEQYESWTFLEDLAEVKEMMPRYPDEDVVKSNITGFFDEFIVLVDKDGSGKIDVDEFRPVWDIMRDAGLTNAQLPTAKELWDPLEVISKRNSKGSSKATTFIELLKRSEWTDPLRCRVLSAGKRFVNVLWNSNKVGSIVCTGRDPVRMFLDLTEEAAGNLEMLEMGKFITLADPSHYGTGDYEVEIDIILSSQNPEQAMNSVLEIATQSLTKAKRRTSKEDN